MKAALLTCIFAAFGLVAEAAPAVPQKESQGPARKKRSFSHSQQYISPCGAASAPIPSYAPSPYHLSLAPAHHAAYAHHGYGNSGGGYGGMHYRDSMLGDNEIMSFSDMDPMMSEHPMARYAYAAPPSPHYGAGLGGLLGPSNLGGLVPPAGAGAPAIGVFPNANPGGCSVPLMLSCSPSIVPGRIVSAHPYNGGAAGAESSGHAYREENELHQETQEADQHMAHESSSPQEKHHVEASHHHQ